MITSLLEKKSAQWMILLLLAFIWGTSFILMKKGLQYFTPGQVASLRLSIACILLMPFSINYAAKLKKQNLGSFIIAGFFGISIPAFLFTHAQTHIISSVAGVLNSLTPLFTLVIGLIFYKSTTRYYNIIGVLIGLAGASALIIGNNGFTFTDINWNAFLIVLATILYGMNVNEIKFRLSEFNGLEVTAIIYLVIGPMAIIYLYATGFNPVRLTSEDWIGVGYVALLAAFSSVFAVIIFNELLKHVSAVSATSVTYIIPVFAIMWGCFDGESFSVLEIVSLCIIIVGVYLVNKK
jgi:drug/metabolite transporter (DMT)-like permease